MSASFERTAGTRQAPNGWSWELLRGFRQGDREALRVIYRLHAEDVAQRLRFGFTFEADGQHHRFRGFGSAFDLHDALHETFRRAFEPAARQSYDGVRPYAPYLHAVARNVVLQGFRRREALFRTIAASPEAEHDVLTLPDAAPSPEHTLAHEQMRSLVQAFLAGLTPADRELALLRFAEGRSQREVATTLGLGRQQVRGRELKLRAALLEFLRVRGESVPGLVLATWLVEVLR